VLGFGSLFTSNVAIFASFKDGFHEESNMSTDREKGRGNKRARVTRGSWNPKHSKRKH
jgi:hypothetical protein